MEYIKVSCEVKSTETKEILTGLLDSENYIGFEETNTSLISYIEKDKFVPSILKELETSFNIIFTTEEVKEENWNALWESNFEPILVDNKVYIRADFHEERKDILHELVITPKMSFGTGHHQTTQMMIQHMLDLDFKNKTVFDFGTGTGVLAIFAEKLGAASIYAIDIDTWSIENCIENVARNNCTKIKTELGILDKIKETYDIIIANINLHIITSSLDILHKHLQPNGDLLISGFLYSDLMELEESIANAGFIIVSKKEENYWSALHLQKKS
jgi:ribosomal protein L11 methyltransferase